MQARLLRRRFACIPALSRPTPRHLRPGASERPVADDRNDRDRPVRLTGADAYVECRPQSEAHMPRRPHRTRTVK